MNANRATAFVIACIGLAVAAFIEYGTPRAMDVERSFGWFAYEAGPWVMVGILALLSPFARALSLVGVLLLAFEAFAYFTVFIRVGRDDDAALVYLFKPFYALAVIAVGVLASFLLSRGQRRTVRKIGKAPSTRRHTRGRS